MPKLLMIVQKSYPNEHPMLETVYTRILPRMGFHAVWVMQPRAPQQSGLRAEWHGQAVYVTRRRYWGGKIEIILRGIELFFEYIRLGAEALHEHEIDLIQSRTGIPEALAGCWLAWRHGKPFVFQNSFPREEGHKWRIEQGPLPWLGKLVYRLDIAVLRFVMWRAKLTLAISEQMREIWQGRGVKRIVAFPLGADLEVRPEDITPVEAPANSFIYFGDMERARHLEIVLDVLKLVLRELPDAHLFMLGDASKSGLPEYAAMLGIQDSVTFTGLLPRADVPRYIRASCCSIAPYPVTPMFTLCSPTKAVESLAMGVPVVGNEEVRDQCEVIRESGGGFAVPYDKRALADKILQLLRSPDEAEEMGRRGRDYVMMHRSYQRLSEIVADRYREILA